MKKVKGTCLNKVLRNKLLGSLRFCEHCVLGKQIRFKFSKGSHTSRHNLEHTHLNLWGIASN